MTEEGNLMSDPFLVVVALRAYEQEVAEKIQAILRAAKPVDDPPETEGHVWYRRVRLYSSEAPDTAQEGELTVADLDRLAAIIGWEAVERLNVGLPWGTHDRPAHD